MSSRGVLKAILLRGERGGAVRFVDEAEAVAGVGLVGDRYADAPRGWARPYCEVTLIEREALDAAQRAWPALTLTHEASRRNLLVEGARLDEFIGRTFRVGDVELRGVKPCTPCAHLQTLVGPGTIKALFGRGGLRAEIVKGGVIRVGAALAAV